MRPSRIARRTLSRAPSGKGAASRGRRRPGGVGLTAEGRDKALERAEKEIEKSFGKGAVLRMSSTEVRDVPVLPTGCPSLDLALGVGGYPYGRMVEVYGPESSGKTTLALHAVAECQRQGGICAFVDAEHALDIGYAAQLGVNVDDLLVSQPDHGEQALQIVEALVRSHAVDLVVVDSVAALVPRAEIEGQIGDHHVGLQARMMSQALRKTAGVINVAGAIVLFINQTRQKIGVTFGPTTTTTGGKALRFYASVRLEVRRIGAVKSGEEIVGNRTQVKVAKNKVAPPFKRAEVDIIYGAGFDWTADLIDLGVAAGLVDKAGAWFSMDGERLGQGRDKAARALAQSPDRLLKLQATLYEAAGLKPPAPRTIDPACRPADAQESHKAEGSASDEAGSASNGHGEPVQVTLGNGRTERTGPAAAAAAAAPA